METIELGMKVRDKVTGFIGITVCKAEYLNGCVQFEVSPPVNEKGEMVKGTWIDEAQLEFVDRGVLPELKVESKDHIPIIGELERKIEPESVLRRVRDVFKPSGGQRNHP